MGAAELITNVRLAQTRAFIEYRPEVVTLTRRTRVADGAGGYKWTSPVALSPQRMRMVPARSITNEGQTRITQNGQTVNPEWMLVGYPNANLQVGDTCVVRGHRLEVVFLYDVPTDRVVAECWENRLA